MDDLDEIIAANEVIENLQILEDIENHRRHFLQREEAFTLPEKQFVKIFRLTKDLTREVINMVTPLMRAPLRTSDLSVEARVLAALNFYANGSYQTNVGQNIYVALSQPSICRSIEDVTNALLNENIINTWIRFPTTLQELRSLRTKFYQKYQIPGIIGCLDCSHIAIVPPQGDPDYPEHIYVNRKNYHSLNVQLICDDNLRIIHINPKFPGSTHDSHIWRESNVSRFMEGLYRRNPNDLYYLIGDSGYPLRPWLMTPLREAQEGPERRYDTVFKTARCTIERCNGVLKGRFRCLLKDRTLHYHPVKASKLVKACAVLHNMCITRGVPDPELDDDVFLDGIIDVGPHQQNIINADLAQARVIQQNIIATYFP